MQNSFLIFQLCISGLLLYITRMVNSEMFDEDVDDIFSSVIGPVFSMRRTPHPLTNNTRTLDPSAFDSLTQTSIPKNHPKPPAFRAPLPFQHSQNEEEMTKYRLNRVAHTSIQLKKLIDEPIHTIPDFEADSFAEITRKFDEMRAQYKKQTSVNRRSNNKITLKDIEAAINNTRRQNRPFPMKALSNASIEAVNAAFLVDLAAEHNIDYWTLQQSNAINLLNKYFLSDRKALERSVAIMEQFVYGARYKFLYAQTLKERYANHIKYRMGYTFAVMENLIHQFYSCYFSMAKLMGAGSDDYKTNFGASDIMVYLKLYEKTLSIQVEFRGMVDLVLDLEMSRRTYPQDLQITREMKEELYSISSSYATIDPYM